MNNSIIPFRISEYDAERETSFVRKVVIENWRTEGREVISDRVVNANVEKDVRVYLQANGYVMDRLSKKL